ncbi:MAG: AmmeMemoRadiSam system protein B [Candidatus Odinarchaeota archaeon]
MSNYRSAVRAGSWYEGRKGTLEQQLEWSFLHKLGPGSSPSKNRDIIKQEKQEVLGIVSPHAGYACSAPIAAHGMFELLKGGPADTFIIIGPNHTGWGSAISVYPPGKWETPLGDVEIDKEVAQALIELELPLHSPEFDTNAHAQEHSIELQVPFLQHVFKDQEFKIVTVCLMDQSLENCTALGQGLARVIKDFRERGKIIKIVASSDFTHFESDEQARDKDLDVINNGILKLDPAITAEIVKKRKVSICGPGGVIALLSAAKELGYTKTELLKYSSSGHTCGDTRSVVGYASISIKK